MSNLGTELLDLQVLIFDCQATNPDPRLGSILEAGWALTRAAIPVRGDWPRVQAFRIRLPEEVEVPRGVARVTGLSRTTNESGIPRERLWNLLSESAALNPHSPIPTVVHFARYEERFLRSLHDASGDAGGFPFQILCTWEISRRLFPSLPRRGLRAVAGFLGYSVSELRRSSEHVKATAAIWRAVAIELKREEGVCSLAELTAWLERENSRAQVPRTYPMAAGKRSRLPDQPGVYRMLRSNGDLLYVGKAKSLKRRVNSYFQKKSGHAEHILEMLSQAQDLEYSTTTTALEAALKEVELIQELDPPYNRSLRAKRTITYLTADLCRSAPTRDADFPVGPVAYPETLRGCARLFQFLTAGEPDPEVPEATELAGIPERNGPDRGTFVSGMRSFLNRHRIEAREQGCYRFIKGLGVRFAAGGEEAESPDDRDSEQELPPEWTEEAVERTLGRLIARGALLLRRARWMHLLSRCAIEWRSPEDPDRLNRIDMTEWEREPLRAVSRSGEETPAPESLGASLRYDRLQVVTTELRRLVAEGLDCRLVCPGGKRVAGRRLRNILQLV